MNIFVKILIGIAALIVIVLIVALFTKKEYTIEREITINKPKTEVFDYLKFLKNQDKFSKWALMDPNMKKEYTGTDGTVGFISAWDSDNKDVGKGEQQIVSVTEGEKFETSLHFIKPFEGKADAWMTTDSVAVNQTKVKWGFKSSMPYPMNIMLLAMNMEKMIGGDLEIGLDNLKKNLEK